MLKELFSLDISFTFRCILLIPLGDKQNLNYNKREFLETMEIEEIQVHKHPLIPFTRFPFGQCNGCLAKCYIYGGYHCNELGCGAVFHKDCGNPLPEINHSSHPDHPLKLINTSLECSLCSTRVQVGYSCSICDFKLDLRCARRPTPLFIPENSYGHKHSLQLDIEIETGSCKLLKKDCKACDFPLSNMRCYYRCHQCEFFVHWDCAHIFPEAYHISHPQHPLKLLKFVKAADYIDKKCLLCAALCFQPLIRIYHCDVCNFSICEGCMGNPPPLGVMSLKTHEHELHLVPRQIAFTCNACGTQGDRSPYFCLPCNFMVHRECIDLPRVININRHDHRISYTPRLGHGEWKCGVCRKKVDGFYGGYSCSKCPEFVVHSRCATRKDVWDLVELEGTPEEPEEPAPFEVIDDNTIKHFSHDHNLHINKDVTILQENILCVACVFQICSDPFYNCKQCDFILHKKCANLPRKKRHVHNNQPFTLRTETLHKRSRCVLCFKSFTGFRYESNILHKVLDVRCGSMSEPFMHESHPHSLYYNSISNKCSECKLEGKLSCDECDYSLCFRCAMLPQKVIRHSYDDHPFVLSYSESSVNGDYWCEACETKLDSKKWYYTCNDCGTALHIRCVVGDFTYDKNSIRNTSSVRPFCYVCKSRCKLPFTLKISEDGLEIYVCSQLCLYHFPRTDYEIMYYL